MKLQLIFLLFIFVTNLFSKSYEVEFQGNKHLKKEELLKVIGVEQPQLDEKVVPLTVDTLQDFYKSNGFYHAKISTVVQNNKLVFTISEGEPIFVRQITIDSPLDINKSIPFVVGDIFDAQKFANSKEEIKKVYEDKGFCNAKYKTKAYIDIVKNSADLLYKVFVGTVCYFDMITIDNPEDIDKGIIESLIKIKKGEIYSPAAFETSYKNLYAYDGIAEVLITPQKNDTANVDVNITVKSNPKPIQFQAGVGASSDQGLSAKIGVKHRNFLGNLKTLAFNAEATQIKQSLSLDFAMPLLNANMFGSQIKFKNEDFLSFKERSVLVNGFLRQKEDKHTLQETLMLDTSTTYKSTDLVLFPQRTLLIVSPKVEWDYEARDNILNPSKGFFINTLLQGSVQSTISDATYYKANVEAGYILPLEPSVLALKVNIGYLDVFNGNVPASYRFFAGGMYSNRAYGYRRLGPIDQNGDPAGFNFLTETTLEYRFKIYKEIHGVVFNDNSFIGDNYANNGAVGYYSGGVGLRYETPIGPLAIDYGFDLNDPKGQYAFHFHIGETF